MPVLPLILAIVPGVYAWWSGRQLIPRSSDPALPELLFSQSKRRFQVLFLTWAAILILAWSHAWWAMLLAVVATLAGAFPARKQMFGEQWNFLGYLTYRVRLLVAFLGAWILVMLVPYGYAELPRPLLGVVVAGVTVLVTLWSIYGGSILLWILGTQRLTDPTLVGRFDPVIKRAASRAPSLHRGGPKGGTFVNGLAIPTPWAPAVFLSDGLLEQLSADEIAGIFAHEVAHLEQFTPGRWWRRILLAPVMALAIGGLYLTFDAAALPTGIVALVWPIICMVVLALSLSRSREDETGADLRAVQLVGDAEPVISGLTKVHVLNRHPRRIDPALQQRMTHPSLARRLQAIRNVTEAETVEGAEIPGPVDDAPSHFVVTADNDLQRAVVFGPTHVQILDGIPADTPCDPAFLASAAADARSTRYDELIAIRVEAPDPKKRVLVITDRKQRSTRIPITTEDASDVQAILDRVDHRLGQAPAKAVGVSDPVRLTALLAVLVGVLPPIGITFTLMALVALLSPSASILAAAGVTGIVEALYLSGLLGLGTGAWAGHDYSGLIVAGQGVMGAWLLVAGLRRRTTQDEENPSLRRGAFGVLLLGVAVAVVKGLVVALSPMPLMQLHLWIRGTPVLPLVLALAVALLVYDRREVRLAGGVTLILTAWLAFMATPMFRRTIVGELFSASPPMMKAVPGRVDVVRYAAVAGSVAEVSLSPDGQRLLWVMAGDDEYEDPAKPSLHLIEFTEGRERMDAWDHAWTSDGSVLLLQPHAGGTRVARYSATGAEIWSVPLDGVGWTELGVAGDRWSVVAPDTSARMRHGRAGVIGDAVVMEPQYVHPDSVAALTAVVPDANGGALLLGATVPDLGAYGPLSMLMYTRSLTTSLWYAGVDGATELGGSALQLTCHTGVSDFLCSASSRSLVELWRMSEQGWEPLGRSAGWVWPEGHRDGWLLRDGSSTVTIYDVAEPAPMAFDVSDPPGFPDLPPEHYASSAPWNAWSQMFAYRRGRLAVARGGGDSTRVVVYEVHQKPTEE